MLTVTHSWTRPSTFPTSLGSSPIKALIFPPAAAPETQLVIWIAHNLSTRGPWLKWLKMGIKFVLHRWKMHGGWRKLEEGSSLDSGWKPSGKPSVRQQPQNQQHQQQQEVGWHQIFILPCKLNWREVMREDPIMSSESWQCNWIIYDERILPSNVYWLNW